MLNSLSPPALTAIAILLTATSYFCAGLIIQHVPRMLGSLVIGAAVVLTGYLMASLHAPMWLIVAAPIPLGFLLLLYQVKNLRMTSLIYLVTWVVYLSFHIIFSAGLHYDSLMPAWRLHS